MINFSELARENITPIFWEQKPLAFMGHKENFSAKTKVKLKSLYVDAKDMILCPNGQILFRVDE